MTYTSFKELIDLWPSPSVLNTDIGVRYNYVNIWKRRDSIPPQYWPAVIKSAKARGIKGVTFIALAELAGR